MPAIISVLYPVTATSTFDLEYYLSTHMVLVKSLWGPHGLKSAQVVELDHSSGYGIQAAMEWEDLDAFKKAATEHGKAIMADISNFTNVKPITVMGSVVASF
jgi:uncharacterized protein (TIGR02118 family)